MDVEVIDSITLCEPEESHTIEDCIPALLDSHQIFIKIEPPEICLKREFDDEIEYDSGDVLYGHCFDDIQIKEEPDWEGNCKSRSSTNNPTSPLAAVKEEKIDEESTDDDDIFIEEVPVTEEVLIELIDDSDDEEGEEVSNEGKVCKEEVGNEGKVCKEEVGNEGKVCKEEVSDEDECDGDEDYMPDSDESESMEAAEETLSCTHCPREFQDRPSLEKHLATHTSRLYACSFTCLKCPSRFPDRSQLQEHLKQHDRPYYCRPCRLEFSTKVLYNDHLQKHETGYKCLYCPKIFDRMQGCTMHMKSHDQFIPNSFIVKSTSSAVERQNELSVKCYPCNLCGQKYLKQSSLNSHFLLKHPDSTNPYVLTCRLCSKTFKKNSLLASHIITEHHNNRSLKCKLCSETFKLISHLKTHLKMCSKEKPYSCLRCSATFKQAKEMRLHFKSIHPDTVYTCAHCYKDFYKKKTLREHVQSHASAYPCRKCSVIFDLEANLKKHLEIHDSEEHFRSNGDQPSSNVIAKLLEPRKCFRDESSVMLSCGHCTARFKQKTDLAYHLKTHYIPQLPGDQALEKSLFQTAFPKNISFSLAQEMKRNFANLKFKINNP